MAPFDCELLRDTWPAQPINTLSAAAFVAVGLWLWRGGKRVPAVLSVAVGTGSIWFHAAPGDVATWAHDLTLVSLALAGSVEVGRQLVYRRLPVLAAAVFAMGLIVWFFSRTDGVLCDPGSLIQGHAVWHVAAAAALGKVFSAQIGQVPVSDH